MQLAPGTHVAVVDGVRFLLMRNTGTQAEPALSEASEPDVTDMGESGASGHHDTNAKSDDHRTQDKLDHAAQVANWLNVQVLRNDIEHLLIVADPDTMGEMRRHLHKKTQDVLVGELVKQLTGMPGPAILKALEAA